MTIDIDQVHPIMRELVSAFLLKRNHPLKMVPIGRWLAYQGDASTYNEGVKFVDPNYEAEGVGEVRLKTDPSGRLVFSVLGREEVSPRRKTYSDRHTKETRNVKKALKLMLDMLTPYSLQEIANLRGKRIGQRIYEWRNEHDNKVHEPIRILGASYLAVIKEMQNLKNLNVPLVTAEFKRVMEHTLAYHEENKYRTTAKVHKVFITYRDDGVHTLDDSEIPSEKVYPTYEMLPEDIRGKIAFLKMLKDGEDIPEVGLRMDDKNFWVVKISPRVDERNV